MKKLIALMLAAVLCLSLIGCGSQPAAEGAAPAEAAKEEVAEAAPAEAAKEEVAEAAPAEDEKKTYKIYYSVYSMADESNNFMKEKALEHVAQLNAENPDVFIDYQIFDAEGKVDKQIADCETMIEMGADAVILNCVDAVGCIPAAQAVMDAGIPLVEWRDMPGIDSTVEWKNNDEYLNAKWIKDYAVKYLDEHPGHVFKCGLIDGLASQTAQLPRTTGMLDLEKEDPERCQVLAKQYGDWKTENAMKIMEDWLQAYPDMNCVITANDEMALGVVNVLKAANKLDDFFICSVDGLPTGLKLVEDGDIAMTIGFILADQMNGAIDTAIKCIEEGFTGTKDVSEETTVMVDKSNVAEFKKIQGVE